MSIAKQFLVSVLLLLGVFPSLQAQTYPSRPIQWIVPFPAGGPTDVLARSIAPKLSEELGVPVVVENRAGAGGSVGMSALAKSAPDGYTIGMGHTGTHAINPHLYPSLGYDPLKDFAPITPVVSYGNILVVHPAVPVNNVRELITYAKANPNKVSFASGGNGVVGHILGELLKSLTGAPMLHVPYKGNAPALTDVMAGNATSMFELLNTGLPQIRAGKLKPLAVTSSKRSPYIPEVPTMSEAGVAGFNEAVGDPWFGIFAPAGTPAPVVNRLYDAFTKAIQSATVQERMRAQSLNVLVEGPTEFAARIRIDHEKWGRAVRLSGAKVN